MTATMRDKLVPGLVVLLMFAGFIKASPAMAWVPVDLTVAAVALLAVFTAGRLLTTRLRLPRELVPLLVLALAFAAPALYTPGTADGDRKLLLLFGITLLSAFTAAVLLSGGAERGWWLIRWTVTAALGVAVLLRVAPSTDELYGRLALEGSNTIAIGRGAGAGIVALWVLMRARRLRWVLGVPAIVALTAVLFGSGSRGPLLAVGVAVLMVALTQPGSRRIREILLVLLGGGVLAFWALSTVNQSSVTRILSLFSAEDPDTSVNVRLILADRSLDVLSAHPLGLGWYGLAPYLEPLAIYPHNIFLEVFGEAGWLPGLIFVAVVFIALRRAFRAGDLGAAVGGLLVFWLVNAIVSGDINDNRMLFATLGVALVVPTMSARGTSPPLAAARSRGGQRKVAGRPRPFSTPSRPRCIRPGRW